MTIGIYRIYNIENDNTYIGQSKNIESRWNSHIEDLRDDKHHCFELQKEYNEIYKQVKNDYKNNDMFNYLDFNKIVIDKYYKFEILESFNYYNENELLTIEDGYILQYREEQKGYSQKTNKELNFDIYSFIKQCNPNWYDFYINNKTKVDNFLYEIRYKFFVNLSDEEIREKLKNNNKLYDEFIKYNAKEINKIYNK